MFFLNQKKDYIESNIFFPRVIKDGGCIFRYLFFKKINQYVSNTQLLNDENIEKIFNVERGIKPKILNFISSTNIQNSYNDLKCAGQLNSPSIGNPFFKFNDEHFLNGKLDNLPDGNSPSLSFYFSIIANLISNSDKKELIQNFANNSAFLFSGATYKENGGGVECENDYNQIQGVNDIEGKKKLILDKFKNTEYNTIYFFYKDKSEKKIQENYEYDPDDKGKEIGKEDRFRFVYIQNFNGIAEVLWRKTWRELLVDDPVDRSPLPLKKNWMYTLIALFLLSISIWTFRQFESYAEVCEGCSGENKQEKPNLPNPKPIIPEIPRNFSITFNINANGPNPENIGDQMQLKNDGNPIPNTPLNLQQKATYKITIDRSPSGYNCTILNQDGTVKSNLNLQVNCYLIRKVNCPEDICISRNFSHDYKTLYINVHDNVAVTLQGNTGQTMTQTLNNEGSNIISIPNNWGSVITIRRN